MNFFFLFTKFWQLLRFQDGNCTTRVVTWANTQIEIKRCDAELISGKALSRNTWYNLFRFSEAKGQPTGEDTNGHNL